MSLYTACYSLLLLSLQVLGATEQRRMAANQREQGEERRMFISPQMLRLLLSARQVGAGGEPGNSDSEDLSAGGSDDGGDGDGGRHRLRQEDCTIS